MIRIDQTACCYHVPFSAIGTSLIIPGAIQYHQHQKCEIEPTARVPVSAIADKSSETNPPRSVPAGAIAIENDETNPTPSDQQRAVARMLVMGYRPIEIARVLGLNHHTIPRWRRNPRVRAEMKRLRAYLDTLLTSRKALNREYLNLFRNHPWPPAPKAAGSPK
jgi:hypothetical protein